MFDVYVRPLIDPPLNFIGKRIALYVSPNIITCVGFLFGVMGMFMIIREQYSLALIFICANRLLDGLDGAVARYTGLTDFGGFLDIVSDFIIYSGVVFAFGLANPHNLFGAVFLIFSFIGPISSFLAYATIAAKRQIRSSQRGKKSFYYLGGICEGTETAIVLILFCVFPQYFQYISIIYGILCWMTTIGRVYNAWYDFGRHDSNSSDFSENVYIEPAKALKPQDQ